MIVVLFVIISIVAVFIWVACQTGKPNDDDSSFWDEDE
jgi:hypothetical protein